jgi:hypothetical protein
VFGASQVPSVGNGSFAVELRGMAPTAPAGVIVGFDPAWIPVDLTFLGIEGCSLLVDPSLFLNTFTGAGDVRRAEGAATLGLPIPGDNGLRGTSFRLQGFVLDVNSGRTLPLTMTNGIAVTIQ